MTESQMANAVIQICKMRDAGLRFKDIDAVLGWSLNSYRVMRTAFAKRIRNLFGI